ncbi:MAG: HAMP domain-containing histidine kinase [Desulfuromonadales bacterium]|nr:HAMP domain-containing histidine kinase [Desulfuromonadales bacterium]
MMKKPTDEDLIEEIRQRFESNHNALDDMRAMTRKLEMMNEKLQDSEALKSHFLSNVRNEINNPLSAIMGLSGQFLDRACDPESCQKTIRMIYAEAFNLDYQLQNVFMAAELEAGEAEPGYAMVEIGSVLDSCIDKLAYRIAEKEIEVVVTIPDDLIFPTDAQKFEIILINLLANAVEFNKNGGTINIEIAEDKAGLTTTVRDNGPGINAVDQEVIFDRFKQLEAGTTKGHRGHGLGLSICWSLAELLDGTLDLDSQPDKGSRFVLILPRPDVDVVVYAADGNFFLFDDTDGELESF